MLKCEHLPKTNSTKSETQNIVVKFQQNEHTLGQPFIRGFHKRTKLIILTLFFIPHIYLSLPFLFVTYDVCKCEIRYQLV